VSTLAQLSPVPLPEEKPTNRGKFSDDRQYWEEVHKRRYAEWQLGMSIDEIAVEEGVTYMAIKHSVLWCEARTPKTEVLAGRAMRLRMQAFARLSERYVTELEQLMSDPNPVVRSRALDHFRKTVGLEGGGGVHVNVNNVNQQQTAFINDGKVRSFEQALQRVRDLHLQGQSEPPVVSTSMDSNSAAALNEANSGDVEQS
jgi:hypothetical protein